MRTRDEVNHMMSRIAKEIGELRIRQTDGRTSQESIPDIDEEIEYQNTRYVMLEWVLENSL